MNNRRATQVNKKALEDLRKHYPPEVTDIEIIQDAVNYYLSKLKAERNYV